MYPAGVGYRDRDGSAASSPKSQCIPDRAQGDGAWRGTRRVRHGDAGSVGRRVRHDNAESVERRVRFSVKANRIEGQSASKVRFFVTSLVQDALFREGASTECAFP